MAIGTASVALCRAEQSAIVANQNHRSLTRWSGTRVYILGLRRGKPIINVLLLLRAPSPTMSMSVLLLLGLAQIKCVWGTELEPNRINGDLVIVFGEWEWWDTFPTDGPTRSIDCETPLAGQQPHGWWVWFIRCVAGL